VNGLCRRAGRKRTAVRPLTLFAVAQDHRTQGAFILELDVAAETPTAVRHYEFSPISKNVVIAPRTLNVSVKEWFIKRPFIKKITS
jgi:hypothetical protein